MCTGITLFAMDEKMQAPPQMAERWTPATTARLHPIPAMADGR